MPKKAKKVRGLLSADDQELKYWLLAESKRDFAWIIEHQIDEIIQNSSYIDVNNRPLSQKKLTLLYTYTADVTSDRLLAVVEGTDGYYLIRNNKIEDNALDENEVADQVEHAKAGEVTSENADAVASENAPNPVAGTTEPTIIEDSESDESTELTEKPETTPEVAVDTTPEVTVDTTPEVAIDSVITYDAKLGNLLKTLTDVERTALNIAKLKKMTFNKVVVDGKPVSSRVKWVDRFPVLFGNNASNLLLKRRKWLDSFTGVHLDLEGLLSLEPRHLVDSLNGARASTVDALNETDDKFQQVMTALNQNLFKPLRLLQVTQVTLHQNYKMVRFESLAQICPNMTTINLINMPGLTVAGVENLCQACPNLIEFSMHYCPRTNFRLILPLLQLRRIQSICLNQLALACQHNVYSGLVADDEWKALETNSSLRRLLVNSSNMSMDVLNFMLPKVPFLERLVIHSHVYQSLDSKLVEEESYIGLVGTPELTIASFDYKKHRVARRPFKITGLLREEYEAPYSDSMLRNIQKIMDREANSLSGTRETGLLSGNRETNREVSSLTETNREASSLNGTRETGLLTETNREVSSLSEIPCTNAEPDLQTHDKAPSYKDPDRLLEDPDLLAEVLAEMRENGEWSE